MFPRRHDFVIYIDANGVLHGALVLATDGSTIVLVIVTEGGPRDTEIIRHVPQRTKPTDVHCWAWPTDIGPD